MPVGFALAAGFTAVLVGTAAATRVSRHDLAGRVATGRRLLRERRVRLGAAAARPAPAWLDRFPARPARTERKGEGMADVVFVLLTIAVFAVLGLILKAVEKL